MKGCGIGTGVISRRGGSATLDALVGTFTARVTANGGGSISAAQQTALSAFIVGCKSDGIWTSIKYFLPMLGADGDLVAARTPVLTGTSGPDIATNTGFVAGDYTAASGLVTTGATKWLDLGYIPSNDSLTAGNSFFALYHTTDAMGNANGSSHLVDRKASVASRLRASDNTFLDGRGGQTPYGRGLLWATFDSGLSQAIAGKDWGFTVRENATTTSLDAALALYAGWNGTTTFPGVGGFGGLLFGSALTRAQMRLLASRMDTFMLALGRRASTSACACIGDSITRGTGATAATMAANRWSRLYSSAVSLREVNYGRPNGATASNVTISGGTSKIAPRRQLDVDEVLACSPSRVAILLGTNDCGQVDTNVNGTTALINAYQAGLESIVDDLIAGGISRTNIIIGSMPYANPASAQHSLAKQALYVAAANAAATSRQTKYADLNAYMAANGGNALITGDNLHPTDAGHAAISTAMQAATQL